MAAVYKHIGLTPPAGGPSPHLAPCSTHQRAGGFRHVLSAEREHNEGDVRGLDAEPGTRLDVGAIEFFSRTVTPLQNAEFGRATMVPQGARRGRACAASTVPGEPQEVLILVTNPGTREHCSGSPPASKPQRTTLHRRPHGNRAQYSIQECVAIGPEHDSRRGVAYRRRWDRLGRDRNDRDVIPSGEIRWNRTLGTPRPPRSAAGALNSQAIKFTAPTPTAAPGRRTDDDRTGSGRHRPAGQWARRRRTSMFDLDFAVVLSNPGNLRLHQRFRVWPNRVGRPSSRSRWQHLRIVALEHRVVALLPCTPLGELDVEPVLQPAC